MPFNGSGTFTRNNGTNVGATTWQLDRDAGVNILSGRHDTHDQDIANGLSNCITKDGQTTITANLPMGGFRHTNVGSATSRTDYSSAAQVQDSSISYAGTSAGSGNTYTATLTPTPSAYATGMKISFKADKSNTGTATLNLNSLGAITIYKNGSLTLDAGDIIINTIYTVIYDSASGGKFHLLSPGTVLDILPDGWRVVRDTWTYGNSTAFTLSGDKTTLFEVGDKIKFTQTTVKYFYVTGVSTDGSTTTITVTGGSTYSVANAAITSPYISKSSTPDGFPQWFAHNGTHNGFSSQPTSTQRFCINGRLLTFGVFSSVNGTSNATTYTINLPVNAANNGVNYYGSVAVGVDNGATITNVYSVVQFGSTVVELYTNGGTGGWTSSNGKRASITISYEI